MRSDYDEKLNEKLQLIIQCENRFFRPFVRTAGNIRDTVTALSTHRQGSAWYTPYSGPFFDLDTYNGTPASFEGCAANLEKAAALPPAMAELDGPARSAAVAMRGLREPGRQFDLYIGQKEYQDDNFARGPQLTRAIDPFVKGILDADKQLGPVVRRESAIIREHDLLAIDRLEGHSLHWHTEYVLLVARKVDDTILDKAETGKMTAADVNVALQPLQTAYDDTEVFITAHPELRQRTLSQQPLWFFLESAVQGELAAAKQLRRDIESPPTSPGSPDFGAITISNDVQDVAKNYNALIEVHNNHASDGPQN